MQKINSIQAMRGVAALLVVLFHARKSLNLPFYPLGDALFSSGAAGVDLFFIISGLIMVLVASRQSDTDEGVAAAVNFLINRISRVAPLYIVATIGAVFLQNTWSQVFSDPVVAGNMLKSLLYIPLNLDVAPFYGYASLQVGWTLNYEMLFYLLFGACLAFGRFRYVCFFAVMFTLLIAIPLWKRELSFNAYNHYHFSIAYLNMMTNPIIWDFVLGMSIAFLLRVFPKMNNELSLNLVLLSSLFVAWQYFSGFRYGHGLAGWAPSLALLVFSLVHREKHYSIRVPKILQYLGAISFSIYLLHPLAQNVVPALLIGYGLNDYSSGISMVFLMLGVTIFFAHWSKKIIEQAVSNFIKEKLLMISNAFFKSPLVEIKQAS
ncbi:acyltransferase [Neisseriaceae bacterium JH1-16]|nr:acyltransferase [Neisseriaceae bacterium JH1-16]